MESGLILHGYVFDGKGGGAAVSGDQLVEKLEAKQLAWVHLNAHHTDARAWLEKNVDYIDGLVIDALLAEETRPRVMEHEKGVLLILRGVNLNEGMDPEDMISIRLWVDESRIISVARRQLKAVRDVCTSLEDGVGPANAGDFVASLAGRLYRRMEPILQELDDRTDDMEEKILDDPDVKHRLEIVDIRKMAIVFKRYIAPQKDVMSTLCLLDLPWINKKQRRALLECQDHLTRYVEDLDSIRERAQIVKDELANITADRMNKNMYVLSIIAAIFLPLGFLTGLLGINVGGMPGADNDMAFWVVCVLCALCGAGLVGIFRLLKWL